MVDPGVIQMLKSVPGEEQIGSDKRKIDPQVMSTWNMLGPVKLSELVKNSVDEIRYDFKFGHNTDPKNTLTMGQQGNSGKVEGICRIVFATPNNHIYEGQCKNDQVRNGFGR